MIWLDLNWSEPWILSRYANHVGCGAKLMTRVEPNDVGDAICENVLQIVDIGAPNPRFWKGSRSASISRRIRKWSASCWDPREWASILIPEFQEFQRLFAQMDILKQTLIKFWSRDTLICDNVLGSGSHTPLGVEFWRIKIRLYPARHRKTRQQQKRPIWRAITLRGKTEGLKTK